MATYAERNEVLKSLGYPTYNHYLSSDLWSGIRNRVLLRDGYACNLCIARGNAVHHLSYSREVLLGEDDSSLVTLCNRCHKKVEFCPGGNVKRTLDKAVSAYHKLFAKRDRTRVKILKKIKANERRKSTVVKVTVTVDVVSPPVITTKRYAPSGKGYRIYTCSTCGAILPKTIRYSAKVYRTPKVKPCTRCKNGPLGPDD